MGPDQTVSGLATGGSLLLERERELTLLEQLLRVDPGGLSRPVVIEGPAGIGKTRLLAELRQRAAAEGLRVLAAQGSDLEREFPYGAVRQLFEPVLSDPEARDRLLDDAAAPAGSIFESLGPATQNDGDVSFAALHGLYWLTINLASEQPLLLAVDDLHWCDRPSLRFLTYLSKRLEDLGVLLVAGLRTAEPGTDPLLIGEIAGAPEVVHVHPGPLSDVGVTEMIRAQLHGEPDPEFAAACRSATGGNPLLLRQLLSSLEADGVAPEAGQAANVLKVGARAVSRTVLMRLQRLPEPATTVAQALAVLGAGAELPPVAELTGLPEADVAAMTAALARAEILRPDSPLGFVHPLVRDAVYHALPPGERELLHARAAAMLIEARAPAETIATHLLAAPRRGEDWIVDTLAQAAVSAHRKGAADSAVAYLQRALQEPPDPARRPRVLLDLGLAETLTSGPAAAVHLREAWETIDEPRERATTAATLARTLIFTAPAPEALSVASQALAETPPELIDERQALRALELMSVFFGAGDWDEVASSSEVRIQGDGPGAKMLGSVTALGRALSGGSAEDCVPLVLRALADDVLINADPGLFPAGAVMVLALADRDDALGYWDVFRTLAHRRGSLLGIVTVSTWRGWTLLWRGDLRDAEESLTVAQRDLVSWGLVRSSETYGPAFLGLTYLRRGDLAQARAVVNAAPTEDDGGDGFRHLQRARIELMLVDGRYEDALVAAERLQAVHTFVTNPAWIPWQSLKTRALEGLGRTDEAIQTVSEELVQARRFGSAGVVGPRLALLGTLEREHGIPRLYEAVEMLERSSVKFELASAQLSLGAALRRARQPTEAREPLQRAIELAQKIGAEGLAEQARTELHAAGGRPRVSALSGPASLTPSERRVADLAVDGRSNKEIAQALFVTPKTVEVHLSNTYRKLDIRSRRELPKALTG
jgi:DNA-binding CsgD family transcriptional regulator